MQDIHSPDTLQSHFLNLMKENNFEAKSIRFISAYTPNIVNYAIYSLFLNYLFVHSHEDYGIEVFYESEDFELYPQLDPDARWNKILYLIKAIEDSENLDYSPEWFIWLDADLILVDFDFQIQDILSQLPATVEIIMSKDKASTSFIANSGFIIVRNSQWAWQFLKAWWGTYDRRTCCDQNALTWLYQRKIPFSDVNEKLIFLDADVINTNFPSWENHHESCPVLHLAGLTSLYRHKVFKYGLESICSAVRGLNSSYIGTILLPSQLNINREYLRSSLIELNKLRIEALDHLLLSLYQEPQLSVRQVRQYRRILEDIMKYEDDENSWIEKYYVERNLNISSHRASEREIATRVNQLRLIFHDAFVNHTQSVSEYFSLFCRLSDRNSDDFLSESSSCLEYLRLIQDTITSGFELLLSTQSLIQQSLVDSRVFDNSRNRLAYIRSLCEYIYQNIGHPDLEKQFLYYLFKQHQFSNDFLSLYSPLDKNPLDTQREQILILLESVRIWELLANKYHYYGTQYVLADPEKEYIEILWQLGVLLCVNGNATAGILRLNAAIDKQTEMVEGYARIYITTNNIIQNAKKSLAEMNYNLGVCLRELEQYDAAKDKLRTAIDLLEAIDVKTGVYYQAQSFLRRIDLTPTVAYPQKLSNFNLSSKKLKFRKKKRRS